MFNHRTPTTAKAKRAVPQRDTAVTILTAGCHFDGKLYCRGSSRIGGKIQGQIVSDGLLIIEEDAVISAEIFADEAIIQGSVTGRLEAKGRVELTATSRFHGDIKTPFLVVNEGAMFNGRSSMDRAGDDAAQGLPLPPDLSTSHEELGEVPSPGHSRGDVDPMNIPEIGARN